MSLTAGIIMIALLVLAVAAIAILTYVIIKKSEENRKETEIIRKTIEAERKANEREKEISTGTASVDFDNSVRILRELSERKK